VQDADRPVQASRDNYYQSGYEKYRVGESSLKWSPAEPEKGQCCRFEEPSSAAASHQADSFH
jgi:hypothetical protein